MDTKATALINGYILQATFLDVLPDMHMDFRDTTLEINVLPSGLFWFGIDPRFVVPASFASSFRRGEVALLRVTVGSEHILRCCRCDGIEQQPQDPAPARRLCLRLRYNLRCHWRSSVKKVAEQLAKSMNRNAQLFLADWLDDYGRPYEADKIRRAIAKQQEALKNAVRRSRR